MCGKVESSRVSELYRGNLPMATGLPIAKLRARRRWVESSWTNGQKLTPNANWLQESILRQKLLSTEKFNRTGAIKLICLYQPDPLRGYYVTDVLAGKHKIYNMTLRGKEPRHLII
jgi:hypothetical protein